MGYLFLLKNSHRAKREGWREGEGERGWEGGGWKREGERGGEEGGREDGSGEANYGKAHLSLESRTLKTSELPQRTALCRAVQPSQSCELGSALNSSSWRAICTMLSLGHGAFCTLTADTVVSACEHKIHVCTCKSNLQYT